MSAEKNDYHQYDGLKKEERRKKITEIASESLETKRFLLSRNPELKKRIKILQEIVDNFKKQYPEIISLNLFGSLTKGYANEQSDFDAYLFIDRAKELASHRKDSAYNELVKAVQKATGTKNDQVDHIFVKSLTTDTIIDNVYMDSVLYITELFLLAVGRDINRYRKVVFDALETMGPKGEEYWKRLMVDLWACENRGLPEELKEKRKKLYPQTVAEGKKVFLQKY